MGYISTTEVQSQKDLIASMQQKSDELRSSGKALISQIRSYAYKKWEAAIQTMISWQ